MSVDWSSLEHAYGNAADVPKLLASARSASAPTDYRDEPWFGLWSALCHQGDVYTASYAALPELVDIARSRDGAAGAELLLLAGCIELERQSRGLTVPQSLADAYRAAVNGGAQLASSALRTAGEADDRRRLNIALAALTGEVAEARRLLGEEEE